MIRWRSIALAILFDGLGFLCLLVSHRKGSLSLESAQNSSPVQDDAQTARVKGPSRTAIPGAVEEPLPGATASSQHVNPPPPAPSAPVADTPESTTLPAATILENMRTTIHQYAAAFGENPVGTNPEITAALQGGNPKQVNFLKQDGNRVNGNGELVDT